MYYARWLDSVGRLDEALVLAQRAVDLSPADQGARDVLNTVQEHQRRALHAPAVQPESPEPLARAQHGALPGGPL